MLMFFYFATIYINLNFIYLPNNFFLNLCSNLLSGTVFLLIPFYISLIIGNFIENFRLRYLAKYYLFFISLGGQNSLLDIHTNKSEGRLRIFLFFGLDKLFKRLIKP
jgi:hypothetical protein